MPGTNYFAHVTAAERYAKSRPYIHPTAIAKFRSFAGKDAPFERALDVGCGTGLSTRALSDIATSVVGIDPSAEMIAQAPSLPGVEYRQSAGEEMPFDDMEFDVITVACSFHWMNPDRFLREARRLLRDGGWVVIYNSWFTGDMRSNPQFKQWRDKRYIERYPSPPRNPLVLDSAHAESNGFALLGEEEFFDEKLMSVEQLADYLLTQTNVIAAVEEGREELVHARGWIVRTASAFFDGPGQSTFVFGGRIWYLNKRIGTPA